MKPEELMLGDLVFIEDTSQVRVVTGLCSGFIQAGEDFWPNDLVQPIPLTKELLLDNGWKEENIKESYAGGFEISVSGIRTFSGPFQYLHQLQHAIRLGGISDGNFFKINDNFFKI